MHIKVYREAPLLFLLPKTETEDLPPTKEEYFTVRDLTQHGKSFVYLVPIMFFFKSTALRSLQLLLNLIFTTTLRGNYYNFHFSKEETDAQRSVPVPSGAEFKPRVF